MGNTFNLPQASYPTGSHAFGPWAVPSGLTGCQLLIARCTTGTPTIWPSATQQISFLMDCSFDGGASWYNGLFGWTDVGGIKLDNDSAEQAVAPVRFHHTPAPTHVRGTLTITGGPILTSASFTTL